VNVLNQPYGGFPWIVLPELAFDTYQNAHNGYGDFSHLEDATLEDANSFHASYYAPSNAILTVAGDCDPDEVHGLAEHHFGAIPSKPAPPHGPWPEPPLPADRRRIIDDALAPQPAFVVGYRTPDPVANLDSYLAYVVAASVLADGEASRLRSRLIHRDHSVTDVRCHLGVFGIDSFFMRDPVLFQVVVNHPGTVTTKQLLAAIDEELARLAEHGPTPDELTRVAAVTTSAYWRALDSVMQRSITFASLEIVHGRAGLAGELPERIAAVPGDEIATAAAELASQHRALVEIRPVPTALGARHAPGVAKTRRARKR
jgi:predicted Zn-dependent peptidase